MNRHERNQRSDRRKKFVVSIFFVFILVASTIGFVATFQQPTQDFSYNDHEFTQRNNQWVTEIETPFGEKEYAFYYHPAYFTIHVPLDVVQTIKASPEIVLTFDPNVTEIQYVDAARFQLHNYLTLDLGKNVQHAVMTNTTLYNFPVERCGARNALYISFVEGNQSTITQENNCITIQSFSAVDYIQYSESIIYRLLGVIENE